MTKRSTLLSIDADVVEAAKKANLNLSQIAEKGIKTHLFPYLSKAERIALDFEKFLNDMEQEGCCFYLPFRVKSIIINNLFY